MYVKHHLVHRKITQKINDVQPTKAMKTELEFFRDI